MSEEHETDLFSRKEAIQAADVIREAFNSRGTTASVVGALLYASTVAAMSGCPPEGFELLIDSARSAFASVRTSRAQTDGS